MYEFNDASLDEFVVVGNVDQSLRYLLLVRLCKPFPASLSPRECDYASLGRLLSASCIAYFLYAQHFSIEYF